MHIIKLRRKLWLYRQIYKLNKLDASLLADGWDRDLIPMDNGNYEYYAINDVWLKLLILPTRSFVRVLRQAILFLISYDKSILISGKKRQQLHKLFTQYELMQLKLHHAEITAITLVKDLHLPIENSRMEHSSMECPPIKEFSMSLLLINDFLPQASLMLLTKIYLTDKHPLLMKRYRLRFEYNLLLESQVTDFINSFPVGVLEQVTLMAFKIIMPNLFVE